MSASDFTFSILDPTRDSAWDQSMAAIPGYSFFHSSAWAKVLHESYRNQPFYLALQGKGGASGGLPLMEVNSSLTGRRGVSLPFTDECAPLPADHRESRSLLEKAIELGRERGWRYFSCHGGGNFFSETKTQTPSYFSHLVDLRKTPKELFASFGEGIRRAIRKAQSARVQVEMASTLEALWSYYGLHCLTRRRHGMPPQPWSFFRQIHRHILASGQGFVALARHRNRPVAGAVFFSLGRQAIFKYGASNESFQGLRPNNLVMWEAIQLLTLKGIQELSLGRTSLTNEGLRRFKAGWGSVEHSLWYLKYDYKLQAFAREKDEAYGWHNGIFRRLPLPISRLLGAFLYRYWVLVCLGWPALVVSPG